MSHTHRFAFSLVLLLIVASIAGNFAAPASGVRAASASSSDTADFTGYFVLHGNVPKGFKGFEAFELTTVSFKAPGKTVPVKPYGFVHAGRKYKMIRIDITGDSLSFETMSIAGTSYQFRGRILRPYNPQGPVFSGWLSKIVKANKVAEAQVEFDVEEGG
jgi:hypothetical protein